MFWKISELAHLYVKFEAVAVLSLKVACMGSQNSRVRELIAFLIDVAFLVRMKLYYKIKTTKAFKSLYLPFTLK